MSLGAWMLSSVLWTMTLAADPLSSILANFADIDGLQASFRETRHVTLLDRPLESEGDFFFIQGGGLLMRTLSPLPGDVCVRQRELLFRSEGRTTTIPFSVAPMVADLVRGVQALLNGDGEAMTRRFHVTVKRSGSAWTLILRPRTQPSAVQQMVLRGKGGVLRVVERLDTSGDRTVTRFMGDDHRRVFTKAERRRLLACEGL